MDMSTARTREVDNLVRTDASEVRHAHALREALCPRPRQSPVSCILSHGGCMRARIADRWGEVRARDVPSMSDMRANLSLSPGNFFSTCCKKILPHIASAMAYTIRHVELVELTS